MAAQRNSIIREAAADIAALGGSTGGKLKIPKIFTSPKKCIKTNTRTFGIFMQMCNAFFSASVVHSTQEEKNNNNNNNNCYCWCWYPGRNCDDGMQDREDYGARLCSSMSSDNGH